MWSVSGPEWPEYREIAERGRDYVESELIDKVGIKCSSLRGKNRGGYQLRAFV